MATYPTDEQIDQTFFDNEEGEIGADDMRVFQKSMTAAGRDYAAMTDNIPASFPPSAHNHAIGDVTGLQGALDDKAEAAHNHAIGDVTGLQGALDAKAEASTDLTDSAELVRSPATANMKIEVVNAHPGTPDPDTLYLVIPAP